ncbi:hypothetical protein [Poriferisphaera sp. WC338]|uniref:hypothetical protein n=1 Tax=Poriferisphaera sp. WC338 TaxID=3425129 RepID=UPI003D813742
MNEKGSGFAFLMKLIFNGKAKQKDKQGQNADEKGHLPKGYLPPQMLHTPVKLIRAKRGGE